MGVEGWGGQKFPEQRKEIVIYFPSATDKVVGSGQPLGSPLGPAFSNLFMKDLVERSMVSNLIWEGLEAEK